MNNKVILIFILLAAAFNPASAQLVLPGITVKEFNGKIIVSWRNEYSIPVSTINIQRSYDSSKNFTTIGSVLNPQNLENGFADDKPPYNKMYYRVFVSFEGGNYLFSNSSKPEKIIPDENQAAESGIDRIKYPWQADPAPANPTILAPPEEKSLKGIKLKVDQLADQNKKIPVNKESIIIKNIPEIIIYPSLRIYSSKDNNIVIHLPEAGLKRYIVKFYDENDNFLFELTKIKEEYLIVEKVNFVHAGWFHFEIFENGKSLEKNKFFISKEIKPNGDFNKKAGIN